MPTMRSHVLVVYAAGRSSRCRACGSTACAHRFRVLHQDHVHARLHDLVHRRVAQVQDLVDHALLVGQQLVVVRATMCFDLLLRGTLWRSSAVLDAQQARPDRWPRPTCSATSGARDLLEHRAGGRPPSCSPVRRSASAMRFGTSSPTTMLRYNTTSVMSTGCHGRAPPTDSQPTPKPGQPLSPAGPTGSWLPRPTRRSPRA